MELCAHQHRAMVLAMLRAWLRCGVPRLPFADVQVADRRLAVVEGKGGYHRVVPAREPVLRGPRRLTRMRNASRCSDGPGVCCGQGARHPLPAEGLGALLRWSIAYGRRLVP